jgi:hypothetical protein
MNNEVNGSLNDPSRVDSRHHYCVYGIGIVSDRPLTLPQYSHDTLCDVECLQAPASAFQMAIESTDVDSRSDAWYRCDVTSDGRIHVGWDTIGEFLVSADGRQIICRRATRCSVESFQVYMLGQALSFALVQQRFEPLHATVVATDDHAVAFVGGHAFGKSTLAACFLDGGCRLLTDDLLMLQETPGGVLAYPGPPRIKVFPNIASRYLGALADGVAMNADTNKLILPIDAHRSCAGPVPLEAIYCLADPRKVSRRHGITIETLSGREAFIALVTAAFNRRLTGRQRRKRQFEIMGRLTELVPVKHLVYPRALDRLTDVRHAVLDDVSRDVGLARSAATAVLPMLG